MVGRTTGPVRVFSCTLSPLCVLITLLMACGNAEPTLAGQHSHQTFGLQRASISEEAILYRLSARGVFEPTQTTASASGVAGAQPIERFAAGPLSATEWVYLVEAGQTEPRFVLGADASDLASDAASPTRGLLRARAVYNCPRHKSQNGRLMRDDSREETTRAYQVGSVSAFALLREETGELTVTSERCVQPAGSLELAYDLELIARQMAEAQTLVLFLDYDGTLAPIVALPQLAAPDADLLTLLRDLADVSMSEPSNFRVHAVSGRGKKDLGNWLGHLPFALHAEHGLISSESPGQGDRRDWQFDRRLPTEIISQVQAQRDEYIRTLMQAALNDQTVWQDGQPPKYQGFDALLVEEKEVSLVLHYRAAEEVLRRDLEDWADGWGDEFRKVIEEHQLQLEVTGGANEKNREVQIKPGTINVKIDKGNIINDLAAVQPPSNGTVYFAVGDSSTDENMFRALDAQAAAHHGLTTFSVHVGQLASGEATLAATIVNSPKDVRALLERVIYLRRGRGM